MRKIVVASGKGGVGKTTLTINLALALTNYGRQVILIDGNFNFPHIGLMLGKSNFEGTIISAIEGDKLISEVVYKHQSGLKMIAGNISLEHLHKKDIEKFNKAILQLDKYVESVIIDTEAGFNKDTVDIIKNGTDIILVTTPDFVSVTETLKLLKVIKQNEVQKILGIVVNKYTGKGSDMKIENIQTLLGEKIIGVIPDHKSIKESLKLKHPVIYSSPSAPTSEAFEKLACNIIGKKYEKKEIVKKTKVVGIMEKVGLKKWYESLMEDEDED